MSKAPKRARSTLREPDHAGRRAATAGWIMGALAAVAVAGASFTLLPAPSPRLASVDRMGVDPVTTGSIDPALRRVDPAELSQLRGELRALREEVAAMRAGAQSLSRRLAVLEAGGDPQLPGVVPDSGYIPMAQAMPPEAVEVLGGSVVVDVRPFSRKSRR